MITTTVAGSFPASLILGFYATPTSPEIKLQSDGIDDAPWSHRDETPPREHACLARPQSSAACSTIGWRMGAKPCNDKWASMWSE